MSMMASGVSQKQLVSTISATSGPLRVIFMVTEFPAPYCLPDSAWNAEGAEMLKESRKRLWLAIGEPDILATEERIAA